MGTLSNNRWRLTWVFASPLGSVGLSFTQHAAYPDTLGGRPLSHTSNLHFSVAINLPDIAVSRDGRRALLITEVSPELEQLRGVDDYQVRTFVKLSRVGSQQWLRGRITHEEKALDANPAQTRPLRLLERGHDELMVLSIGESLDENPVPDATSDGSFVAELNCYEAAAQAEARDSAGPEEIQRYVAAKIY